LFSLKTLFASLYVLIEMNSIATLLLSCLVNATNIVDPHLHGDYCTTD